MTLVLLAVAAWAALTVHEWRRHQPTPVPPETPTRTEVMRRLRLGLVGQQPLPPLRLADIPDPEVRFAAAHEHAARHHFLHNPFEIGAPT